MKQLFKLLIFTLSVLIVVPVIAQSKKDIKKDIHQKAMKEARKEAKKLKKEGFKVAPGQLPMEKQIESTWIKRYEIDNKGNKKWFVVDARAVGETHSAAKMQASEVAKVNLAGQIGSEVAGLIETNIANAQLNAEEAASVTETVATFKSIVGSKLGRTSTFFEADKTIGKILKCLLRLVIAMTQRLRWLKKLSGKGSRKKQKCNQIN